MLRSYTTADALTIGNAVCGTIAIFLCLDYLATGSDRLLWTAFLLMPLALVSTSSTATSPASAPSVRRLVPISIRWPT